MTDKLELKSSHEIIETVDVADVESIFYCKPTDPDILTVLMKDGKRLYCDEVCPVDSLQEEPVSEKKCMFTKDNYTDEDRKTLCEDCKEKCKYSKEEEPVSEDLDKAALDYANKQLIEAGVTDENCPRELAVAQASLMVSGFKAGAKWQKQQMTKDAVEYEFYVKEGGMSPFTEGGSIPVLAHTNMIQLPKDKFKVGDKVKVYVFKE